MLPKDFKVWDIFENKNGYLSIVYAEQGNYCYVLDYNGSFSKISKTSEQDYNFVGEFHAQRVYFFDEYPMDNLKKDYAAEVKFWEIHDAYYYISRDKGLSPNRRTNRKLLLLLTF